MYEKRPYCEFLSKQCTGNECPACITRHMTQQETEQRYAADIPIEYPPVIKNWCGRYNISVAPVYVIEDEDRV